MRDALLKATLLESPRSSPAADARQLQISLSVPAEWVDAESFDKVQLRLIGRVRSKVDFATSRELVLCLTGNRSRADFQPRQSGRSETSVKISTANFDRLPLSTSETGKSYFNRQVGFGGKYVHGECDISYHVEARIWRAAQLTQCFATDITLPKPELLTLSTASTWQAAAVPKLPKLMRRAFLASSADLVVKIPHVQALEFRRDAGEGGMSIRLPVTVVHRREVGRLRVSPSSTLRCDVESRWYTRRRIATRSLKKADRQEPLVDYTVRTDRRRLSISFPPFSHAGNVEMGAHSHDYTTTADVELEVPKSIDVPTVSCNLFERSYELKLLLSIDAGGDLPQQTASGIIPVVIKAHGAGAGSWMTDPRTLSEAGLMSPPPAYANAMDDPILLAAAS